MRISEPIGVSRWIATAFALWMAIAATPIRAVGQWPGEVAGTVTDAASGAPVEAALVELPGAGRAARTDGAGRFRLRALEPGEHRIVVSRTGYAAREASVEVANGRVSRLAIHLQPVATAVEGVRAVAERDRIETGTRVTRAEIEASGARTAAEVLERVPGVVVRSTGVGSAQTVSVRGGSADAVLVLVDGAPANDPVTGEADLSAISAGGVESVTVLPGARTARYGPRAEAGVVLIETRAPDRRQAAELSAGSLGERSGRVEWGGRVGGALLGIGGHGRRIDGAFDFERDPNDPTILRRQNAELDEWGAWGAAFARVGGGELRARGGWDGIRRGIPGQAFAPSPEARQELDRGRGSLAWRRTTASTSISTSLSGAAQTVRYADPAPPFGLAYDDRARVRSLHLRTETERSIAGSWLRGFGGGFEIGSQRVDAGSLSDAAPRTRTDGGAFAHAAAGRSVGGFDLTLTLEGRVDRDGVADEWYGSRAATLRGTAGGFSVQLANRSAFSPPTLGDQFFREGVAVAPNPDLRPERVPNEWELGAGWTGAAAGVDVALGAAAYRGDVRGMIVWAPDFRFVWSPRNTDVKRRGMEAWAEVGIAPLDLALSGAYTRHAVTYDRPGGGDDGVQLAYRPRHAGQLRAAWTPGPWRAEAAARYTGGRNPTPSPANALPGFWSVEAGLARDWRAGAWALTTAIHADRLFDEKESLIFGYPEPGRRLRVDVRVRRAGNP